MSGVAGRSGRKPHALSRVHTGEIITDSAPFAMQYLSLVARGKVKRPSPARIDVCRFIVEQCIGRATQRIEHKAPPSAPLSYDELLMSAEKKRQAEDLDLVHTAEEIALNGPVPNTIDDAIPNTKYNTNNEEQDVEDMELEPAEGEEIEGYPAPVKAEPDYEKAPLYVSDKDKKEVVPNSVPDIVPNTK